MTEVDAKRHADDGHFVGSEITDERNFVGGISRRNPRREQHFGKWFHRAILDAHGHRDFT